MPRATRDVDRRRMTDPRRESNVEELWPIMTEGDVKIIVRGYVFSD